VQRIGPEETEGVTGDVGVNGNDEHDRPDRADQGECGRDDPVCPPSMHACEVW
jgi:hypothetical protein